VEKGARKGGSRWVIYSMRTGRHLLTWNRATGFWSAGNEQGRLHEAGSIMKLAEGLAAHRGILAQRSAANLQNEACG
jgi:hypothetical protein